ncbi:SDR family NAD(P)-dependent oxidoreductase [Kribbella sandramycini]|uniref:NAD(P)-dependent dehydrogenase (Short-subunit alcohol dehydrogenase family) n=1 Tax=Kribbella sandramycini TaxID=60450 RepID=A0A7Y4NWU4_9ACTN|nr:oxidoreductase [Kribbella sandramycini]MBB6568225.1 NAD(P)-dependent dehydrogenase (short-subunit alcohol dehydrogenase family) [Kribbella sandramycini]NOL39182.1 SDR family NAD(P)-dependent oxidoreductase [Kribbella sandramycini]
MTWSTADIPDLTGRRALVTGATSGLGYETAKVLLERNAEVVLAARNPQKTAEAAVSLTKATGKVPRTVELDLADLASVERAASELAQNYDGLDILVNNAGVMATPYRQTIDGFELQIGTNHLGHFALTGRLMPLLANGRVVTVSSFMHKSAMGLQQADLRQPAANYSKWPQYSKSKLANILFMLELGRRVPQILSVGAHPGYASTHLQAAGPELAGQRLQAKLWAGMNLFAQSAAAGAWPSLYAATQPGLQPGAYVGPSFFEYRGTPKLVHPTRLAQDPALAERLWSWSVEATGIDPALVG